MRLYYVRETDNLSSLTNPCKQVCSLGIDAMTTKNEKSYLNMMDFALGKIDYEEFMKRFSM